MNQEDKNEGLTKKTKKLYFVILLAGLFMILVLVSAVLLWYLDQDTNNQKSKQVATEGCGPLVTEDSKIEGLSPYSPVVKAKISGEFPKDQEVCQWTINGKDYGTSRPYGNYCIRYGLTFHNIGDYKISYKVNGLENCPKETTLKVTGLSEAEKARLLEIKRSGIQPEDLQ